MAALRILHVAPYFEQAWAYGGIPRVVSAQVHALAAAGHRVTVATSDVRDAAGRIGTAGGHPSSRFVPRVSRLHRLRAGLSIINPLREVDSRRI